MYLPNNLSEMFRDPLAKKLSLWGFLLGGIFLILFVPENILFESPFLAATAHLVSEIIPSIDIWTARSSFPQVTKIFFAYCWLSMPFVAIIIALHKSSEDRFVQVWREKPKARYFRTLLLLLFTGSIFSLSFYIALPEQQSCTSLCIHSDKVVQCVYGVCMLLSVSGLIALIIWWIKNFKIIILTNYRGNK